MTIKTKKKTKKEVTIQQFNLKNKKPQH